MAVREIVMSAAGANDFVIDAFSFASPTQTNAEILTNYSTSFTPTGYDSTTWTVTNGQGSTDNVNWSSSGSITKGQTFYIRVTSSSSYSTGITATATFGGVISNTFVVTTRAVDLNPNSFSFAAATGVNLTTVTTSGSNPLTISGMDPGQSVTVTVSGGEISAGTTSGSMSAWTSSPVTVTTSGSSTGAAGTGTIAVSVRGTSSSAYNTTTTVTVTVNGTVSSTFSITTKVRPSPTFTFVDETNKQLNTYYNSSSLTITGYDTNQPITVSASGGLVDAGATALSGTYAASKSFNATTGQVVVSANVISSSNYNTDAGVLITINDSTDTYTVRTRLVDTTPDDFNFSTVTDANPSALTSTSFVPTGYDYADWTVSNGQACNNNVNWATSGRIFTGETFYLRQNANSQFGASNTATIGIGGITGKTWTVTTRIADVIPNAVGPFNSTTGVQLSTITSYATSNGSAFTVQGLEPNYTLTVGSTLVGTGGTLAKVAAATYGQALGTYGTTASVTTDGSGRINVSPRITSNAYPSNSAVVRVNVGSSTADWTVTTRAPDLAASFTIPQKSTTSLNTLTTSDLITVTGLEPNYPVSWSVTGTSGASAAVATYGTTPTAFTTSGTATTDASGQLYLYARVTSASSLETYTYAVITIGTTTQQFDVLATSAAPNNLTTAFNADTVTNANPTGIYYTQIRTITGLTPSTNYSITMYTTGGAIFKYYASNVTPTAQDYWTQLYTTTTSVTVQSTASGTLYLGGYMSYPGNYNTESTITFYIKGVAGTYSVTTRIADIIPSAFAFSSANFAAVAKSTFFNSDTVTVGGVDPGQSITITASGTDAYVDAGKSALSGTFATSKTIVSSGLVSDYGGTGTFVVRANVKSSAAGGTAATCTVTVSGNTSAAFTVTTTSDPGQALYDTPGTYTWTAPPGVTSVCVACIGGGAGGGGELYFGSYLGAGGGGGGLGYKNNIAVTPGTGYTVVVGSGGTGAGANGTNSYFISTSTVSGRGGVGAKYSGSRTGSGGGYTGDGGGNGGSGGYYFSLASVAGGGGGAGGFAGGGGSYGLGNGNAGTGGGGGGGGNSSNGAYGYPGGGTGIIVQGTSGTGGTNAVGGGGSGGTAGNSSTLAGGSYGGGAGGVNLNSSASGGGGAVRIIWGTGRSYPSNSASV